MYCRNCGHQINDNAAVCLNCGVKAGVGDKFCPNCGKETMPNAQFCTGCGVALRTIPPNTAQKSRLIAGILGILLGGLGVHNFYLGFIGKAVAQIILNFCCGIGAIWGFIEGILILTGNINRDANGVPLGD